MLCNTDLDKEKESRTISISGKYNEMIRVEKGRIRFDSSGCPDKLCVKAGWLSKKGDMAVCLRGSLIIKIEGQSDDVDGVTF
jgi:hypothetical protein